MYQFEPINDEYIFQEFCKDLLNLIYNTKSFQTYKTKGSKQHGIDIFCNENKIVVQCKKKKLLRSDKSLENELFSDFNESIELTKGYIADFKTFILITTTKKYGNVQDYSIKLSSLNSFEVLFWSWEDIEPYIAGFESLRKKYYPHLWTSGNSYPKVLTYIPKINEEEIVGRNDELLELHNFFKNSNKSVLINGIGGVGKSTLAKLYVSKNFSFFNHIIWIDIQNTQVIESSHSKGLAEAFSNNITLLKNINLEFEPELSVDDKLLIILNKIQNIEGKNILIIDNVSNEINNYKNYLPTNPNWDILIISRERVLNYSVLELKVLDNISSIKLFYKHYKIEENNKIVDILNYIGNHTLTIELMAKTANKRNLSIEDLIYALEKEGLNISKVAKVNIDHGNAAGPVHPFEYLISIFYIADLSESQQELLMFFSILPSKFIDYDDLKLIFCIPANDNDFFEDINELVSKGWLIMESFSYQMHQVIQEVIRQKLNPTLDNCKKIVDGITETITMDYNKSYIDKLSYLSIADNIILRIYNKQTEFSTLLNNTAVIHQHNGNQILAIKYYEEVIDNCNEKDIFKMYINLAVSYMLLGEFSKALEYNLKNISFLEKNDELDLAFLAMSYNNLAENYRKLGKINEALDYNLQALKYYENIENSNVNNVELATIYNNLAGTYSSLENRELSLECMLKTIELREKTLEPNHPHLAQAYNNVAVDYEKLGLLEESEHYHLKALKIREEIFKIDHYDLAETYNNFAQLLILQNKNEEAIYYHEKSILIRLNILPEYHPEIALAYNNFGGLQLRIGDFLKAKNYIGLAVQIGEKHENLINPDLALFYLNYSTINLLLRDLDIAKAYISKSIKIYEVIFDESHPNYKASLELQKIVERELKGKIPVISKKIGRNEICYCSSNKKYKKCCGK